MRSMPTTIRFLRPNLQIILPTNGLQNMTAKEYIAKIYPIQSWSISLRLNSKGKNGAMIAYAAFDRAVILNIEMTSASNKVFSFFYAGISVYISFCHSSDLRAFYL